MQTAITYPDDLTDAQWALLHDSIPPAKQGGRPRTVDMRAVVNGCFYLLRTGCQWNHLPKSYPKKSSVHAYFSSWYKDGTWERIHDRLRGQVREDAQKNAEPSVFVIDSQSVRTTEKGGPNAALTGENS